MFKKFIDALCFWKKKPTVRDEILKDLEKFVSMGITPTSRWIAPTNVTVSNSTSSITSGPILFLNTGGIMDSGTPVGDPESSDQRVEVTPKDIVQEFEQPVDINLEDLERKLGLLYERAELYKTTIRQPIPPDIRHAISILEARKNYPKLAEWIPWKTTTQEKINDLCKKYKLSHQGTEDFIPELPQEAVDEITAYRKVHEAAFSHEPKITPPVVLSIIAPTSMFKTRKGDPILLAKSPFGDFFYVLCAWDEEVAFVKDLLA
jgi:hypothetical protein